MSVRYVALLSALVILLGANSCRKAAEQEETIPDDTISGRAAAPVAPAPEKVLKDTAGNPTYDTIQLEGKKEPVKLTPYSEKNYGVATYIPGTDFIPRPTASGEGMAVNFIANFGGSRNEKASVNVFFPAGNPGIDQLRDMTIGPRGLLATNKWRLIKSFKKPELRYAWAQEQYTFQHKNGAEYSSGSVLIGESAGRAMQVTILYPAEYGDGFPPRAHILLKYLTITPLKEPVLKEPGF